MLSLNLLYINVNKPLKILQTLPWQNCPEKNHVYHVIHLSTSHLLAHWLLWWHHWLAVLIHLHLRHHSHKLLQLLQHTSSQHEHMHHFISFCMRLQTITLSYKTERERHAVFWIQWFIFMSKLYQLQNHTSVSIGLRMPIKV